MRRNLVRSWLAASLLVMSSGAALLATAQPAAANDNNLVTVYLSDTGFSVHDVQARVGDTLLFQLSSEANDQHSVTWDDGKSKDDDLSRSQGHTAITIPMNHPGRALFYDKWHVAQDPKAFSGVLTVTPAPAGGTAESSSTTTSTTVAAPTTTTTTRPAVPPPTPATTSTTTPASIHPLLMEPPPPATTSTTTTTTAPKKATAAAEKDKGRAKDEPTTTTTAPPVPAEPVFDSGMLTPSPNPLPAAGGDASAILGPSEDIDAAAVANLLPDKAMDDNTKLLIGAVAGFVVILLLALGWRWINRSSRYFPA
ncbi:MAG TPA: hypothetical protein VHL53_01530 [Acidimicrobiia bacterium]|nr:hypothetical protein [Acidimicrobiia bacterium]